MLSILATGQARYNTSGLTNNLNFDNQSTIVGENAGKDLKIAIDANFQRNFYNTFVGYQAGRFSIVSSENIYVGFEAGIQLNGSNNIMIGKNFENGLADESYNAISIGWRNKTYNNSLSGGLSNFNQGTHNSLIGHYNNLLGNDNTLFGNRNELKDINNSSFIGHSNNLFNIYSSLSLGNNNLSCNIFSSVILGNNNTLSPSVLSSNIILIGNNNSLDTNLSSNCIYIGDKLYNNSNYLINIDNTIVKYDNYSNNEILFLGLNNKYNSNYKYENIEAGTYGYCNYGLHVAVGFTESDINNIDNWMINSNEWSSMYIKNGMNTDKITFNSYTSNLPNISFLAPAQIDDTVLASNITYTLPFLPVDTCNLVLTTNYNGELYWRRADRIFVADTITIYNTDQLKEGGSNLYFTNNRGYNTARVVLNDTFPSKFDEFFYPKLRTVNIDQIQNGTSNKFITNGVINQDIIIFGTLTVNKIQVLGTDIKNENNFNSYVTNIVSNTSNELISIIQTLINRITYLESRIT